MPMSPLPPYEMAFARQKCNGGESYSKWTSTTHEAGDWWGFIAPFSNALFGRTPLRLFIPCYKLVLPRTAKRLYAVATNGKRPAHGFQLVKDGGLKAFSPHPCRMWRVFLEDRYAQGYRWVQFQYEE